jgi:hypothetical protein
LLLLITRLRRVPRGRLVIRRSLIDLLRWGNIRRRWGNVDGRWGSVDNRRSHVDWPRIVIGVRVGIMVVVRARDADTDADSYLRLGEKPLRD